MLFVRCTRLQVDHLIDGTFDYFAICRIQNFVLCFYHVTACNAAHGIAIAILSVCLSVCLSDACTVAKLNDALRIF